MMRKTPVATRLPLMPPENAQQIARGLKRIAQSYAEAGRMRDAARTERECKWWTAYATSLAQTPPMGPPAQDTGGRSD